MVHGFESLNDQQFATLKDAIAHITVLIAGADGNIDHKETEWATKLTHIRSYSNPEPLGAYYEAVGVDFASKVEHIIENAPKDVKERTELLSRKLAEVNSILPKLENHVAAELYNSFKSFAKHVAKSSGGFFGMMSINKDEAALIDLPMIEAIIYEEEE